VAARAAFDAAGRGDLAFPAAALRARAVGLAAFGRAPARLRLDAAGLPAFAALLRGFEAVRRVDERPFGVRVLPGRRDRARVAAGAALRLAIVSVLSEP
jgi:hypothetical protein